MNRFFPTKPKAPTTNESIDKLQERIKPFDEQIRQKTEDIKSHLATANKLRPGPGKELAHRNAKKIMGQRRQLEAQRDNLQKQVDHLGGVANMTTSLEASMASVEAMKQANKQLKKQYGKIDIDKIERMQDEMADLMDIGNEIQETMARSYEVPDDVDESELDAELELLGAEMEDEAEFAAAEAAGGVPDFLRDEVPQFIDEPPTPAGKVQEAAR